MNTGYLTLMKKSLFLLSNSNKKFLVTENITDKEIVEMERLVAKAKESMRKK